MDRSKFIYKLFDSQGGCYGTTTDIYLLPIGTKFTVENGVWDGEIVGNENKKYMHVIETGLHIELKADFDYGLVINIQ